MLISVIMPVYNNMTFLKRSIDSILEQTYTNWELLIVDDGSTEPIYDILDKYNDDRIIITKNEKNLGTPITLNNLIDMSKGDVIARQDSDDISLPTRFEKQVELFKDNVGVVGSYGYMIGVKENKIANRYLDHEIRLDPKWIKKQMVEHGGNYILGPAAMFSKKVVDKIGYYDEAIGRGAEDTNYWLRALQFFDLDVVKEDLFLYRSNPKSMRLFKTDQFGLTQEGKIARRAWVFERSKTHTFLKERPTRK